MFAHSLIQPKQVRDLVEQLGSGGKSAHELEKALRRAALEREELARALEEAERALEQGEARAALAQLEVANARADAERRVRESGEEAESGRRLHARALESMQASLDGEVRSKAECVRQKRKLEGDVSELEVALDQANRWGRVLLLFDNLFRMRNYYNYIIFSINMACFLNCETIFFLV